MVGESKLVSREEFFAKQQAALEERRALRRANPDYVPGDDTDVLEETEGDVEVEEDHLTYSEAAMMCSGQSSDPLGDTKGDKDQESPLPSVFEKSLQVNVVLKMSHVENSVSMI